MQAPDIPRNEHARLATLRSLDILDTRAEERFDRITRMARQLFDVPVALVSLVDENRQWFKSCIGLSAREGPRETSFCGHAILGDDVFLIPDASRDERFADNPQVVGGPRIRFYAGCPLKAPDGHKLGTLCVIDHKPRHFDQDEVAALRDLASIVENELNILQLATMDELTNLSNRRGFMLLAQHSLRICEREGVPASLIYLDLDEFKSINDSFGHAAGDRALITFADVLRSMCRSSDVIGRLGGDEFAVLIRNATTKQAGITKNRIRDALDSRNRQSGEGYAIFFSHGVVDFNRTSRVGIEQLLENADWLMYQMKRAREELAGG